MKEVVGPLLLRDTLDRSTPRREAELADNHMPITEREICWKTTASDKSSLLHMENLTLPSFQVVVMTANMGCDRCRGRVSQVVSKMTGLTEYTVDVRSKQVTIKGDFISQGNLTLKQHLEEKCAIDSPKSLFQCLTHSSKRTFS